MSRQSSRSLESFVATRLVGFLAVIAVYSALLPFSSIGSQAFSQEEDVVESDPEKAASLESRLITNPRQLTFEGRRAGEGYFSQDGSLLVFQSERRADNPFFQIYLMDLETGDLESISPGSGKTTCAWIHPDNQHVMFASTHEDPEAKTKQQEEIDLRESGQERRYSWDYDKHFEIYAYDREEKDYSNLTNTVGYDAEGSYSPDGSLIAFASNRNAYSRELSEREQEMFDLDPAYMMDIFIMNADGSNVRQLTDVPGYDGGPFFSPDGKRICWRRFAENGATAEIYSMNIDGSDVQCLTSFEAMSWAPYYHPSGEYLIFTTNRHGFANFELYLVDAKGRQEPQRVTFTKGFDGLPVFSPDGSQIAWTSNRTANGQSQLYFADWNHEVARELLQVNQLADADPTDEAMEAAKTSISMAEKSIVDADLVRHVDYLCRPELGGRMTGSRGEKLATAYVAAYFEYLGLEPAGDSGDWFQEFEFTAGLSLGESNALKTVQTDLELDRDWRPLAFSKSGPIDPANVVFAGYGITAPATEEFEEYDSYVHLDVKDKWVMVFRFMPEGIAPELRQHFNYHSSLRYKAMQARDRGARGIIFVSGPNSNVRRQLIPLTMDGSVAGTSIPVITIADDVADAWLKTADKSLSALQTKLDNGDLVMGFELTEVELQGSIELDQVKSQGRNVIGRLQVGDAPSAEAILVGAHIDHLGSGNNSSSLARDDERGNIHFGADDNASGVAAMLEIAEYLADLKAKGKLPAKRDIIFAAWSGEELGTLGSSHFVKSLADQIQAISSHANPHADPHSAASLHQHEATTGNEQQGSSSHGSKQESAQHATNNPHSTANKEADPHAAAAHSGSDEHGASAHGSSDPNSIYPYIAACLNMDMVGRFRERLVLQGIGSSPDWKSEIERRNAPIGLPIVLQNDCFLPTDATEFYLRGVPILAAFTGQHQDYHTPRDTADKLNYKDTARIARLIGLIARSLAMRDDAPAYTAQEAQQEQRRANLRAWLGTVPEYGADEVVGVPISGATKGSPADKAGLQSGDVIVELAGKTIENIYDYTYAIEALKIGQEVDITVARDGKRVELKITPSSRN